MKNCKEVREALLEMANEMLNQAADMLAQANVDTALDAGVKALGLSNAAGMLINKSTEMRKESEAWESGYFTSIKDKT
jgi:hypothetical protein